MSITCSMELPPPLAPDALMPHLVRRHHDGERHLGRPSSREQPLQPPLPPCRRGALHLAHEALEDRLAALEGRQSWHRNARGCMRRMPPTRSPTG